MVYLVACDALIATLFALAPPIQVQPNPPTLNQTSSYDLAVSNTGNVPLT